MRKKTILFSLVLLLNTGCDTGSSNKVAVSKTDPLLAQQWHLENTGQHAGADVGGTSGEDLNLGATWETYRGEGIKIGIVDTGIELLHPDLSANIDSTLSFHYNQTLPDQNRYDPTPDSYQLSDDTVGAAHGTACAGIAAAVIDNGYGGSGVAPQATLAGLNAFSNPAIINFADALYAGVFETDELNNTGYPLSRSDELDISSNSWADEPGNLNDESPEMIAIRDGVARGRGGKGVVYCFAAGNFRKSQKEFSDNANWYREQNTPYVVAVAALDANGRYASYSNFGANILISAFGGEDGASYPAIISTDLRGEEGMDATDPSCYNVTIGGNTYYTCQEHFEDPDNMNGDYTNTMNGTSAATPMTAGVVALVLDANPTLTYRDVRYILATTARKNDPADSDWVRNGAGHWINHNYGFGAIDVNASIAAALTHTNLQSTVTRSYSRDVNLTDINDTNPAVITFSVPAGETMQLEFAELTVTNLLGQVEDLDIILQSPMETNSTLTHTNQVLNYYGYDDIFAAFTFGSVRYLDENSSGTWRLYITDNKDNSLGSTLDSVTLTLHGRNLP